MGLPMLDVKVVIICNTVRHLCVEISKTMFLSVCACVNDAMQLNLCERLTVLKLDTVHGGKTESPFCHTAS